jgi:general secretion pathway protein D
MRRAVLALLTAAFLAAGGARAAEEPVTLNFVNADIESVAAAIGKMTGRNFIIDPRVRGTINIVSAKPVPASSVYGIFLSALRLQGFTAVESGGATLILPEAEAKLHGGAGGARGGTGGDRLQTRVFALKYTAAAQLMPVLRPIISPNNTIAAFPGNNSLVITDYGDNLRRLENIIEAVDRPGGGGEPVVIPLQYAAAADVLQTLNRVLPDSVVGTAGQAGAIDPTARLYVAQDPRTNSIVVRTENPSRIEQVRSLIRQLDVPTSAAANVHVVYLKNAEAVSVAQTLRGILSGDAAPLPVSAAPTGASAGGARGGGAQAAAAQPGGMVQADPASNALLISAPDAVFAHIKAIIEKLDVRRAQVYVEALIVEMRADKAAEFGVQWQSVPDLTVPKSQGFGGTNFTSGNNIIGASQNLASVGRGINVGVVRGQVTIPGVGTVTNIAMLARALATDADANILSTPHLLTLDNEEAKIVIGQNVPFITGQYAQTGSSTTATPFQTIERQDVGLTLRIKPQISEGGTVRMQVFQEASSVRNDTNPAGIVTDKRAIQSTVLVDDGQIIAIGGLMQDDVRTSVEKVPLLGDIPGLGLLFRYETRTQSKTNLVVFLRPVVLRDAVTFSKMSADRYRDMLEEQKASKPPANPVLPEYPPPELPPLGD